ncbi:MAG: trehalose-phosphatase [Candidatus Omnitrophica bacterium]|nr:trehalose-phosphatase [Candidatus Omnitrophota bacterium]
MKYIFADRGRIGKALKGRFLYLFLDYDGTLAPIARTPGGAVTPKRTRGLLRRLSKLRNCKIAVVSGRKLSGVEKRIRLKNIVYAGNHGFEVRGPGLRFEGPVPPGYKKSFAEIKAKLRERFSRIDGVIVEDKSFSLGVHYRLAAGKDMPLVKKIFYSVTGAYEKKDIVTVKAGKMALEIRPPTSWDKGKVVLWLLEKQKALARDKKRKVLPVYIGDDTTDEDAFEVLKDTGLTIFVGRPRKTKAEFYLKDTEDVAKFLETVLNIQAEALRA